MVARLVQRPTVRVETVSNWATSGAVKSGGGEPVVLCERRPGPRPLFEREQLDAIGRALRDDHLPNRLAGALLALELVEGREVEMESVEVVVVPKRDRVEGLLIFGDVEIDARELAAWQATLPERSRYGIVQALRQTLAAGVRWDYMSRNPAKLAGRNPEPPPRSVRAYTFVELDALAAEL